MPARRPPYWDRLSRNRGFSSSDYDDGSPYRDYNDSTYTDHYEDSNYPDWHDDRAGRLVRPPDYTEKLVTLTKDGSRLLTGDEHIGSALFAASLKDSTGAPIDVLPKLLGAGWKISRIEPGLADGERIVILRQIRR